MNTLRYQACIKDANDKWHTDNVLYASLLKAQAVSLDLSFTVFEPLIISVREHSLEDPDRIAYYYYSPEFTADEVWPCKQFISRSLNKLHGLIIMVIVLFVAIILSYIFGA